MSVSTLDLENPELLVSIDVEISYLTTHISVQRYSYEIISIFFLISSNETWNQKVISLTILLFD